MRSRSSTSSSEARPGRWPISGLLALLLVLAIDGLVFRLASPWQWLSERVDRGSHRNLISDRRTIELLGQERDGKRYAVLMGTSRMQRAWKPRLLDSGIPESLVVKQVAHPRIFPPEIRAAADEMRDRAPDVVVLGVSELDTHVKLMLDRRTAFPGAFLFVEASRHLGMSWLFEERSNLLRSALARVVSSYRYRNLLGDAGLHRLRRFRSDPKPKKDLEPDPIVDEIVAEFDGYGRAEVSNEVRRRMARKEIARFEAVASGPHADAQVGFMRRAVEVFRDAGSEVVILELPMHPSAARFYDAELRQEFLVLAAGLERDFGARVIRVEDQPAYERGDFRDLTHVNFRGAAKLTRTTLSAILEALR